MGYKNKKLFKSNSSFERKEESKNTFVLEKPLDSHLQNVKIQQGTNADQESISSPIHISDDELFIDTSIRIYGDFILGDSGVTYSFRSGGSPRHTFNYNGMLQMIVASRTTLSTTSFTISGGDVKFDDCAAGFDQQTVTYNASDTEVNFTTGNKQYLALTGNVTDLNLNMPDMSGNFVLLIKQDGSTRTITNYKVFDSAGSAASGSSTVKFSGGSNPDLTDGGNKVDIISFYWDATNEICYGVASLNF